MSEFITSMKQKMANLKEEIEAMRPGTEERKTGIREWRRLKRTLQRSDANGVIKSHVCPNPFSSTIPVTYAMQLEFLTPNFWSNPLSSFFTPFVLCDKIKAQTQLDADRSRLEKMEKRIIEYLVVAHLKGSTRSSREAC